ncbi:uncharacterized protein TNCT_203481 [Trichonephila clavata]|uniref:Uncharacterized protein n=1 Tax=Trichonephila clavata TaxID=2740835 RepID=A0A8X6LXS8_TRICU|nr:uncharacterized protein TNCT_203481 [Trichonephila clavata]
MVLSLSLTSSSKVKIKAQSFECKDHVITLCQCGENGTLQDVYVPGCLSKTNNNSYACQPCLNSCDTFSHCKSCSKKYCLTCPPGRTGKFCENSDQTKVTSYTKPSVQEKENGSDSTNFPVNKLLSMIQRESFFLNDKDKYNYAFRSSEYANNGDLVEFVFPVDNRTAFYYPLKKINFSLDNLSTESNTATNTTALFKNVMLDTSTNNTDEIQLMQNKEFEGNDKYFERFFDFPGTMLSNESLLYRKHISASSDTESNLSKAIADSEVLKDGKPVSGFEYPKLSPSAFEELTESKIPETLQEKLPNSSKELEKEYEIVRPLSIGLFKITFITDDNTPLKEETFAKTQNNLNDTGKESYKNFLHRNENLNTAEDKNMSSINNQDDKFQMQKFAMKVIDMIQSIEGKYKKKLPSKTNDFNDVNFFQKFDSIPVGWNLENLCRIDPDYPICSNPSMSIQAAVNNKTADPLQSFQSTLHDFQTPHSFNLWYRSPFYQQYYDKSFSDTVKHSDNDFRYIPLDAHYLESSENYSPPLSRQDISLFPHLPILGDTIDYGQSQIELGSDHEQLTEQHHHPNSANKKQNIEFLPKLIKAFLRLTNPVEIIQIKLNNPSNYKKNRESLQKDIYYDEKLYSMSSEEDDDSQGVEQGVHNSYQYAWNPVPKYPSRIVSFMINSTKKDEMETSSNVSDTNNNVQLQNTYEDNEQCLQFSESCAEKVLKKLDKELRDLNRNLNEPLLRSSMVRIKIINPHPDEIVGDNKTVPEAVSEFLKKSGDALSKFEKSFNQKTAPERISPAVFRISVLDGASSEPSTNTSDQLLESKQDIKSRSKRGISDETWCPIQNRMLNADLDCTIWSYQKFCILECHPGFTSVNKYFRCSRKQDSWNPLLQPCIPVGEHKTAYRTGQNNLAEIEEKDSIIETNESGDESEKNNDESETEVKDARFMKFVDSEEKENNDNQNQFGKEIEYTGEDFELSENTKKTENENNSFVLSDIAEEKYTNNNHSMLTSKEIIEAISGFLKSRNGNEKEKDSNGMNSYQYGNNFPDESSSFVKIINSEGEENNNQEKNVLNRKEGESESLSENENIKISSLQPDASFHLSNINNKKENGKQKERKGNLRSGNFTSS